MDTKALKTALARLIKKHGLRTIQITVNDYGNVIMTAYPGYNSPVVFERRDKALAEAGGEVTVAQASAINDKARGQIAHVKAETFVEALDELQMILHRQTDLGKQQVAEKAKA